MRIGDNRELSLQRVIRSLSLAMAIAALAACGGGGEDAPSTGTVGTLSNTGTSGGEGTASGSGTGATPNLNNAAASRNASAPAGGSINHPPTGPNGAQAAIGAFSAAERNRILADGLQIWRAQRIDINGINKGACADCHSADGIELAMWKFTDDDMRRRAHIDGVSPTDRETLVDYFAALRQKYNITTLKDVANDRPFQPMGQPFDGNKSERDLKFATETLAAVTPTLVSGVVDSLAKAVRARGELRASDPLGMRIGIPMPRMSEDCSRGVEHCSSNDWMADTPRIPKRSMEAQWFAVNDAYMADPTDARLRELLIAVDVMTDTWRNPGERTLGAAGTLGSEKFKSMQILQHLLRRQQLGLFQPGDNPNPLAALSSLNLERPNFPFLVGDFGFNKNGVPWETPQQMPVFVRQSLGESSSRALTRQDVVAFRNEIAQPWWYAGFMFDTNLGTGTNREYFFGSLGQGETGGYPFHLYYVIGKHGSNINVDRGPTTPNIDPNFALSSRGWKNVGEDDLSRLFNTLQARQLYRHMEANWTRMWMFLMKEQIERYGTSTLNQLLDVDVHLCASSGWQSVRGWAVTAASFDTQRAPLTLGLYNDLNRLANCGLPPLSPAYQADTGTGLRVEWFAGSGDEFNGSSAALRNKLGERVEPIISFPGREDGAGYYADYTRSIGVNVVENSAFSARGSGWVKAPVTGEYEFFLSGGFGRLTVAGKEIYKQFRFNESAPLRSTVVLQAGQRVPIVFERHGYAAGGMSLEWRLVNGSLPRHKVPTSQLYPN